MILVQVIKDAIGSKGPRLSTTINLSGPRLVYIPSLSGVSVSRRIESEAERERLKACIEALKPEGKIIVRTKAEGQEDFTAEFEKLESIRQSILKKKRRSTGLVYAEIPLEIAILRENLNFSKGEVWVDDKEVYKKSVQYLKDFNFKNKISYYDDKKPLFEKFNIEKALASSLNRKVRLKSGGTIVIDEGEAMVSIDINTGRFVGRNSQKTTILKTNLEAVKEIAFQLRVRNCGGIIVIDLIDMDDEPSRKKVIKAFERELKKDRIQTEIISFSSLSLIQMVRKRTRPSLKDTLCRPCPSCRGHGYIKSPRAVAAEIFKELEFLHKEKSEGSWLRWRKKRSVEILSHPDTAEELRKDEFALRLEKLGLKVELKEDPSLDLENFDFEEQKV